MPMWVGKKDQGIILVNRRIKRSVVNQAHTERPQQHHSCYVHDGKGGSAVGAGRYDTRDGLSSPYTQSRSPSSSTTSSYNISQSSTYTPIPTPSSGSSIISRPPPDAAPATSCSLRSAVMRSSASGAAFGGSSTTCSQPTGGEPGGEIRKFFSIAGGRRCEPPGGVS
jgi:hypothetical protein